MCRRGYMQKQESRAIARNPHHAAVVRCGFADIHYKFNSNQDPKAIDIPATVEFNIK